MIILKEICHNNWLDCIELEVEDGAIMARVNIAKK